MSDCYKKLILRAAEELKPLGFKKSRDYLYKKSDEGNLGFISFIDDKRQSQKEADRTHFTVEVCVTSKKLLERFAGVYRSGKQVPQENDYSIRLGYLMGSERDVWWDIHPGNQEAVTAEIVDRILTLGVPDIEREISDEAICCRRWTAFEQGYRTNNIEVLTGLAYLLKESGRKDDFASVASYIRETYGDRETVAKFLSEMGFSSNPSFSRP